MNWILIAFVASIATALTSIFSKLGLKTINANFATAYRTLVVIIFALLMTFLTGSIYDLPNLSLKNIFFLILSGICTGLSWIFYHNAVKIGDVNKVIPIDKASFVLSSILFILFFFDDTTKSGSISTIVALVLSNGLILLGTILMANQSSSNTQTDKRSILYAVLSAIFASLVSLLVKLGLRDIPSDLGTALRTIVVFIFAVAIVISKKEYSSLKTIRRKDILFLTLSGIATGVSWLSEYYVLGKSGVSPVAVSAITKLSILFTMFFSYAFLKEKFTKKSIVGLILLVLGILTVTIFSL